MVDVSLFNSYMSETYWSNYFMKNVHVKDKELFNTIVCKYQRGKQKHRRRTDKTMAYRKMTKKQTVVDKTLHRKLKIEQHKKES